MNSLESLRVHIAPVGFEVDRIVLPARQMRADRVWLLNHDKPEEDKETLSSLRSKRSLRI